jgi:exodeoxyribonuclease V beta subunit
VLSFIGSLSDENKEAVLSDALASAQLLYPHFNDFKSIKNKLKELLDSQAVKPLFYLKEEELFREKEVVDCFGATRRIDRLIVKKEEVWIIDYKSSKQNRESSYSQLKDYISLVKDLYPDKRALGFLVYLDELTMEKVDE